LPVTWHTDTLPADRTSFTIVAAAWLIVDVDSVDRDGSVGSTRPLQPPAAKSATHDAEIRVRVAIGIYLLSDEHVCVKRGRSKARSTNHPVAKG